jgi:hypothetical protein
MRPTLNERWLSRTLVLAGAFLALASPRPLPAHAESPDSSSLMRLDDRLLRTRRVRITTPSGWLVAGSVRVSAGGLEYRNVLATPGGEAPSIAGRVPWEEVIRVDVPSNHALGAALVTGLVVGGLAGAATYSAGQRGEEGGPGVMIAVPVAVLLATGVGALTPAWHPIYRRPRAPAHGQ